MNLTELAGMLDLTGCCKRERIDCHRVDPGVDSGGVSFRKVARVLEWISLKRSDVPVLK